MKVASIELLSISLAFASGAKQGRLGMNEGKKTNGQTCLSNSMCASNCCTANRDRKYVCSPNKPGTVCSSRFTGGSSENWLDAINTARENQQKAIGGSFTPSEWSPDLANKAQAWANTIAAQCSNGVPVDGSNPEDYGVNTILNVANPDVAVV
jgi:hypothetical protein